MAIWGRAWSRPVLLALLLFGVLVLYGSLVYNGERSFRRYDDGSEHGPLVFNSSDRSRGDVPFCALPQGPSQATGASSDAVPSVGAPNPSESPSALPTPSVSPFHHCRISEDEDMTEELIDRFILQLPNSGKHVVDQMKATCRKPELADSILEKHGRPFPKEGNIFISGIFHNNANQLPYNMYMVLHTIRIRNLQKRVHYSFYESGSNDATPDQLRCLRAFLSARKVPAEINTGNPGTDWGKSYRIPELTRMRNIAFEPVTHLPIDHFKYFLFTNDVAGCPADLLQIIDEHVLQDAHMTCASDMRFDMAVYDTWVIHNQDGKLLNFGFKNKENIEQATFFWEHLTVNQKPRGEKLLSQNVFSCWGGMNIVSAKTYYDFGIRFRAIEGRHPTEPAVSECQLFSKDMWLHGMTRIVSDPRAYVGYEWIDYVNYNRLMAAYIQRLPEDAHSSHQLMPDDAWAKELPCTLESFEINFNLGDHHAIRERPISVEKLRKCPESPSPSPLPSLQQRKP